MNKNNLNSAFDALTPSESALERVRDKTLTKVSAPEQIQKTAQIRVSRASRWQFAPLAAAALVVVIAGAFGLHALNNPDSAPHQTGTTQSMHVPTDEPTVIPNGTANSLTDGDRLNSEWRVMRIEGSALYFIVNDSYDLFVEVPFATISWDYARGGEGSKVIWAHVPETADGKYISYWFFVDGDGELFFNYVMVEIGSTSVILENNRSDSPSEFAHRTLDMVHEYTELAIRAREHLLETVTSDKIRRMTVRETQSAGSTVSEFRPYVEISVEDEPHLVHFDRVDGEWEIALLR
jgi:hypothetical protein